MPGASPAHELSYAERITARLCGAAPEVVLSHALQDEDRGLRPSPLIAALPLAQPPFAPPPAAARLWAVLRDGAAAPLETIVDEQAPPLPPGSASVGGTGVFRDQAACPFRAFALHRLHARPLEEPSYGISPGERGNIVHGVMQRVWEQLGSQAGLLGTDEAALRKLVNEAITAELTVTAEQQPSLMPPALQRTETARVGGIVLALLALERERTPFTVAGLEQAHEAEFGGIAVSTRIDRIDRLEDGSHVVIDYKTGATTPSSSAWFGERPDEPQLPLYCASGDLDVRAVAFGALQRGDTRFVGLAADEGLLPGLKRFESVKDPATRAVFPSREAVIDHWRAVLERLGAGFRQGVAWVDPRKPATCTTCPLPGLCRIHELRGPATDGEDADSAGERDDD
jgi:probable DNA repair protein